MGLSGEKTFFGIGFGPIQSGLFIIEAYHSGNFKRVVIAEIKKDLVKGIRNAGGYFNLNTAFKERIINENIGPIEIYDPTASNDEYEKIISVIAEADELSTAIPSVDFYERGEENSAAGMLSAGLLKKQAIKGPKCIVYTAENNNRAAEILHEAILKRIGDHDEWIGKNTQILNTVIGKMSQVVHGEEELTKRSLLPITEEMNSAFLVESFNKILITKINIETEFSRGITVFREKDNLLPFEEAKLYGHNSTHALIGYIGKILGLTFVKDMTNVPGFFDFIRKAFIEESGEGLIRKYQGVDDLFTRDGYAEYAIDLLERMINPYLGDSIDRIIRDPARKLGWNDRLIGTIRMARANRVAARRFTLGVAAAVTILLKEKNIASSNMEEVLIDLWTKDADDSEDLRLILSDVTKAFYFLKENYQELLDTPDNFFRRIENEKWD